MQNLHPSLADQGKYLRQMPRTPIRIISAMHKSISFEQANEGKDPIISPVRLEACTVSLVLLPT